MKLFISPHNDDETLFGAFTLMREKPLVVIVTDSWKQQTRGENITADQRWQETVAAMNILGCPVIRLGIRDDIIDEWSVNDKLSRFAGFEQVFAPAEQGGNDVHDLTARVAVKLFGDKLKQYSTYAKGEWYTKGNEEIKAMGLFETIKRKALDCYESQIELSSTKGHFDAVRREMCEWYI